MTFKDILDTIVVDAGDTGTNYRANALLWLNLARQDAVAKGSWKSAKNSAASLTTTVDNTEGIYVLTGFDEIIGGELYDVTHNGVVVHDTENTLLRMKVTPQLSGNPVLWADAGMSASGEKQIRLWPVPADITVLNFLGTKVLTDITADDEDLTIDPFFGALSGVGSMLRAGLRYYHDLNNGEDTATTQTSLARFDKMIELLSAQSGIDANSGTQMEPVNRQRSFVAHGRFDPGHYRNY